MKRLMAVCITISFLSLIGSVVADIPDTIPDYVDYHVYQEEGGSWTIITDAGGINDVPLWNLSGDTLFVPNQPNYDVQKYVWLKVYWDKAMWDYVELQPVVGTDDYTVGYIEADWIGSNTGGAEEIWQWVFPWQPDYETITFYAEVNGNYVGLYDVKSLLDNGYISRIDVATYCVPTPGALLLCSLGIGLIAIKKKITRTTVLRRRKRSI